MVGKATSKPQHNRECNNRMRGFLFIICSQSYGEGGDCIVGHLFEQIEIEVISYRNRLGYGQRTCNEMRVQAGYNNGGKENN